MSFPSLSVSDSLAPSVSTDSTETVVKAYKKAMLRVHPDRMAATGDELAVHRATVQCTILNEAFGAFKKKHGL